MNILNLAKSLTLVPIAVLNLYSEEPNVQTERPTLEFPGIEIEPFSSKKLLSAEELTKKTAQLTEAIDKELGEVNNQLSTVAENLDENPSKAEKEKIEADLMQSIANVSTILNKIDKNLIQNREVQQHEILDALLLDIEAAKLDNNHNDEKIVGFIQREKQIEKWQKNFALEWKLMRQAVKKARSQINGYEEKLELWMPIIWRQQLIKKVDELLKDLEILRKDIKGGGVV